MMTQEYISARTWAVETADIIESGARSPLHPYTTNVILQELFGELVEVPRDLCNPEIYLWKKRGVVAKMPWYIGQLLAASDALARVNALETFRAALLELADAEGLRGEYDAPLLWMLFHGGGCADRFKQEPGARALISAMGDIELTEYLMVADPAQVALAAATVMRGIRYISNKEKRNGTSDV